MLWVRCSVAHVSDPLLRSSSASFTARREYLFTKGDVLNWLTAAKRMLYAHEKARGLGAPPLHAPRGLTRGRQLYTKWTGCRRLYRALQMGERQFERAPPGRCCDNCDAAAAGALPHAPYICVADWANVALKARRLA